MNMNAVGMKGMIFFGLFFLITIYSGYSQTSGTLSFSCTSNAPNGTWGTKHVLAVWLENTATPTAFIKTKAKYGSQDDHLTSWTAKSGSNLVDATTGATLLTYNTISGSWNGTNVTGTVVPDGTYKLFMEMGWGSNKTTDHVVTSFTFVKGPSSQHLTPAATANYSNIVIDWTTVATLVGTTENLDNICVYPNPATGLIHINFNHELQGTELKVVNSFGKIVISERNAKIPAGPKQIDLSTYPNGLYFITIQSESLKYTYKVLINR
jgi:hypothetical protein